MFTNQLKKGDEVVLRNGWKARIEDNKKGDTRLCTVYGFVTEMGSVYSHDIMCATNIPWGRRVRPTPWVPVLPVQMITHTEKQKSLKVWSDKAAQGSW